MYIEDWRRQVEYSRSMTATVYIFNNGKVLLHKHKRYGSLFPVGGHIEKDELPEEAAMREIKEETGLKDVKLIDAAKDLKLSRGQLVTPFFMLHENIGRDENIDFIYAGTTESNKITPMEGESNEFYWLSLNDIHNNTDLKPHIRNVVLELFKILKLD